jgi:hypothetical protein
MIDIRFNMGDFLGKTIAALGSIPNPDFIPRAVASDILPEMRNRIFVLGQDSTGGPIGEYKSSYLKTRERYNRTEGKKVVLSLTRQMENDLSVVVDGDRIGIGFKNPDNYEKAVFLEEKYQKHVLSQLTPAEQAIMIQTIESEIKKLFS